MISATGSQYARWRYGTVGPALLAALLSGAPTYAQASKGGAMLIPRKLIFGNPDRANPTLSPDGKQIAFLAPREGVLNVWVAPADDPAAARPVTADTQRGIREYHWAFTNQHILYLQDKGGDENWRVYCTDVATNKTTDLTPFEGVQARIQEISRKQPGEILVAVNNRDAQLHDIHRVDLRTGQMKRVKQNDGFLAYVTDENFAPRLALRYTPQSELQMLRVEGDATRPFASIGPEDSLSTGPIGFDQSGQTLFMTDSRGRDTAALKAIPLDGGPERVLAEDARADAGEPLIHPTEKTVQAVAFDYDRQRWQILDPTIKADFEYLKTVSPGDLSVTSRSLDDRRWIVTFKQDDGPVRYYRYDRGSDAQPGKATYLFSHRKDLEDQPLSRMHPVVIRSRDGLDLVAYLTLPRSSDPNGRGRPDKPLPMVLNVHGGPWARDQWGFDAEHQWLANRGYAVLSVNFRGSTGFGKKFINAANHEWAGKMHDDLLDAVQWAVKEKIADPAKIAIMGGSYGGYATLVGMTFTPDVFAAGVSIVGPSSLVTLMENIPAYWYPFLPVLTQRVGDPATEEGRKFLLSRSPLTRVDKIKRPLLIGQGANDPRVKQVESDQIVQAMQKKKIPVAYVLFPDEGHGFARPENRLAFYAIAEAFLARHLGGQAEPIGDEFKGSSVTVPVGADMTPGVAEALAPSGQRP